jgi:exportin-5
MLKVLEHILMTRPVEQADFGAYNDAVKELQTDGMYELQRLASKMPDQLLVSSIQLKSRPCSQKYEDVYDQLEAKVNEIISTGSLEPKRQVAYQTFLFTIM